MRIIKIVPKYDNVIIGCSKSYLFLYSYQQILTFLCWSCSRYAFSRRIMIGLLLSVVGDACLIWKEYFLHGMMAFGVAQIMYSSAFGFTPLKPVLGIVLFCLSMICKFIEKI